jgi:hypothetical protein
MGGLVKRLPHPDLADPPGVVGLARLIPPGVSPKWAPACFDDLNRLGSSAAAAKVSDTMAPTEGVVINGLALAFTLAIDRTRLSNPLNSRSSADLSFMQPIGWRPLRRPRTEASPRRVDDAKGIDSARCLATMSGWH